MKKFTLGRKVLKLTPWKPKNQLHRPRCLPAMGSFQVKVEKFLSLSFVLCASEHSSCLLVTSAGWEDFTFNRSKPKAMPLGSMLTTWVVHVGFSPAGAWGIDMA